MIATNHDGPAARRKQVRLRVRPDLDHVEQRYEGKRFYVVKDPVCLKYYRFNQQEYFVFRLFDGGHSMEDVRLKFEDEFRPHRLEFQDLEAFARQLVTAGLVQHEQAGTGKHLFERRAKQRRMQRFAAFSNIMYYKIPVFDPDRLLSWMYKWLWWIFTPMFFYASVGLMLAAVFQITVHFQTFYDKLPAYEEFFAYQTVLYLWISLGVVKVIHEFGHGLSCKAYAGECHEMGVLLMCFSPALYANVTDAWTVADKWKRIIISFAGIYVELLIAAMATFVWWYTPHLPIVNNIAMCLMVLCSVSTVMFNANPLMRFDGYYMLADWLEIPNLRDRANKYLNNLFLGTALGVETPPEAYMAPSRKVLFVVYAVGSYVYRWVVTFGILWFLSGFLNPKLKVLSRSLAVMSLASMFIWPVYRMLKNIRQRGRLPDMKKKRVAITLTILVGLIAVFLFVPLPISRVRETGMVTLEPTSGLPLGPQDNAILTRVAVTEGQVIRTGDFLAEFSSPRLIQELAQVDAEYQAATVRLEQLRAASAGVNGNARETLETQMKSAETELRTLMATRKSVEETMATVVRLQAPARNGNANSTWVAMNVPGSKDIGKMYDRNFQEAKPVMTLGDPTKLIVKVPVNSLNYQLLQEDIQKGELQVAVYVVGRTDRVYEAKLKQMPTTDTKNIPTQLTQRGGGPLAVKQSGENGQEVSPIAQTYLLEVEVTDPDSSMRPGTLVQVKIYCKWRSGFWWVKRKLAEALDLGLYQ